MFLTTNKIFVFLGFFHFIFEKIDFVNDCPGVEGAAELRGVHNYYHEVGISSVFFKGKSAPKKTKMSFFLANPAARRPSAIRIFRFWV
mgnify:CR=1 FL=1